MPTKRATEKEDPMKRFAIVATTVLVSVAAWAVLAQPDPSGVPVPATPSLPASLDTL